MTELVLVFGGKLIGGDLVRLRWLLLRKSGDNFGKLNLSGVVCVVRVDFE